MNQRDNEYMKIELIKKELQIHNQSHLLKYYDELTVAQQEKLLSQISNIDWGFEAYLDTNCDKEMDVIEPIDALDIDHINDKKAEYLEIGCQAIKDGKLCLLLLAGGQGTRLGYDKPKGSFNIGKTKDLFIFELLIEHTMDVVKMTGSWIPFYIMTSHINYNDTVSFFEENNYFGYNKEYVHFFVQELNPVTDFDGKILMNEKSGISFSPNGNGGWFTSMNRAGLLEDIFASNIEWINVFSVDNVLQRIADPVFLGATIQSGKMSGSKVVRKVGPEEKVGVMCLENGKPHIIEYYELSDEMKIKTNEDGSLAYGFGVILNYLFPIKRLQETLNKDMPLHVVKKAVPYIDEDGNYIQPSSPNGYKFETLALDLIHEMDNCLVYEVDREKEFAPVKNREGVDSIVTAQALLEKNGYQL